MLLSHYFYCQNYWHMRKHLFILCLFFCITGFIKAQNMQPPVCDKQPKTLEIHGDQRIDNYYWLDQYWLKGPDSSKVVDYLTRENDYFKSVMQHTVNLQDKLYNEMLGRIKQTDE